MLRRLQVTETLVASVLKILNVETELISLSFSENTLFVAVEDIRSILKGVIVSETSHPEFQFRVPRSTLSEVLRPGYFEINVDKTQATVTFRNFNADDSVFPEYEVVVPYSMTLSFSVMSEEFTIDSMKKLNILPSVFNQSTLKLLNITNSVLRFENGIMFSVSPGFSFYFLTSLSKDVKFNVDSKSYSMISKNKTEDSGFFLTSKNSFVMLENDAYYRWRPSYTDDVDLQHIISLEPLATFVIKVPITTPFIFKRTNRKKNEYDTCLIDTLKGIATIKSESFSVKSNFEIESTSETKNNYLIEIKQDYFQYFYSHKGIQLNVYQKFIRLVLDNGIIDIGGSIHVL